MTQTEASFQKPLLPEVLYHRKDKATQGYRVGNHDHAFWQIEYIKSGNTDFRLSNQTVKIQSGEWLLIPPKIVHSIRYKSPTQYVSIKFELSDPDIHKLKGKWKAGPVLSGFGEIFTRLIPRGEHFPANNKQVSLTLAAVIEYQSHFEPDTLQDESRLLHERALVLLREADGTIASVKDLAIQLNCSPDYLSAQFKAKHKRNLKGYIDFLRIRKAKSMITYSEGQIGEIADSLGFNDIYSFSRYFKAHTNKSPRQFRKDTT